MTIFASAAVRMVLVWRSKAVNPIKTRVSILVTGAVILQISRRHSGTCWITILILLLFMGGIIIIFMILSSILPNEKTIKIKNPIILIWILALTLIYWRAPIEGGSIGERTKSFLSSGQNFYVIITLILIFFVGRMRTLRSERTPMRSLTCYQSLIL